MQGIRSGLVVAGFVFTFLIGTRADACDADVCIAPVICNEVLPDNGIVALSSVTANSSFANAYSVDATGLPILNSLPSAGGVAYIDFNGGTVFGESRGAYDLDGDPTTFNADEQDDIYNAWLDVSAHFAMFDINVTTVAPNKSVTPTAHQIVTPDYSNAAANVNRFGDTSSVARAAAQSSYARTRSTALTHEFGHVFGMLHQSEYDEQGERTREYRRVDSATDIAPIMGVDYQGKFSSWQDGFTGTNMNPQDDIAIMTAALIREYNDFYGSYSGDGFRPDEHGDSTASATVLSLSSDGSVITGSANGIIERYTDTDMFSFNWGGGDLTLTAEAVKNVAARPEYASSLGMDLILYDVQGQLVTQDLAGAAADVEASVSLLNLAAGTYFFAVESAGAYDDLGAYTIELSGNAPVPEPARMSVNLQTGEIKLINPASNTAALEFEALTISSAIGALDPASWASIAGNYDGSGDGSIDSGDWSVLTAALTQLSEAAEAGGDDGSLGVGSEISLGNTWVGALDKDLIATYTDLDGSVFALEIIYEGVDNILGDLNTDGLIDAADWVIFISNNQADLSGLNVPWAYRLGDLDGDLDNDLQDFRLFKTAFEAFNPESGAFEAMVASVPEPGSLPMMLGGVYLLVARRRNAA